MTAPALAPPLLVFTDLDGTLLNDAYTFAGAEGALAYLAEQKIPLVLATSKTRAELTDLAARLPGVPGLIFENGAGITCPGPEGPQTTLYGPGYPALLNILQTLGPVAAPFEGFTALGAARVGALTGLTPTRSRWPWPGKPRSRGASMATARPSRASARRSLPMGSGRSTGAAFSM